MDGVSPAAFALSRTAKKDDGGPLGEAAIRKKGLWDGGKTPALCMVIRAGAEKVPEILHFFRGGR